MERTEAEKALIESYKKKQREYMREYRKNNEEQKKKQREYMREYRKKNKEKLKEQRKEHNRNYYLKKKQNDNN